MSTPSLFPKQFTSSNTQPQTIRGIKKRAKKICLPGQAHSEALDIVARELGYRDYFQAQNELNAGEMLRQPHQHSIFLTAYWRDTTTTPRSAGCETLQVRLGSPLNDVVSRHQAKYARNLDGFRQDSSDHLELMSNQESQARAWERLFRAALSLQFMEVTGLRPATTQKHFQALEQLKGFPLKDHVSLWIDPKSGNWVALDEPYEHVNNAESVTERDTWISGHNLYLAKPSWSGLYYPNEAVPHLISPSEGLLRQISKVLEELSAVATLPSDTQPWSGTSESYISQFISPARQASGVARKARPGTTYGYSKGAVEYQREAGYPVLWRPETTLSLADHKMIGGELQCLMVSPMPLKAYDKIRSWCSTLENWMFSEYREGQRNNEFYEAYYGGRPSPYKTAQKQLSALQRIRTVVLSGYMECKPRRDLLKDLGLAEAIITEQPTA